MSFCHRFVIVANARMIFLAFLSLVGWLLYLPFVCKIHQFYTKSSASEIKQAFHMLPYQMYGWPRLFASMTHWHIFPSSFAIETNEFEWWLCYSTKTKSFCYWKWKWLQFLYASDFLVDLKRNIDFRIWLKSKAN